MVFGLVGLNAFSLYLGLKTVGDETGDLALSFLMLVNTGGLVSLIVFKLVVSLDFSNFTP
jgi:hypothetical protein